MNSTVSARRSTVLAAALFALITLLTAAGPALAETGRVLPSEPDDRDSAPTGGLVWGGVGRELMPRQAPEAPPTASSAPPPASQAETKDTGNAPQKTRRSLGAPQNRTLSLSIPKLDIKDVRVPDSAQQSVLDRQGIMHLSGTDFPWQARSNTYIAGHVQGYSFSRVQAVFRNLDRLKDGDRVVLRDAKDRTYTYRVYKTIVVSPLDYAVTRPVPGRDIVSLQTCWPAPTYEKRMVVRAELVD